MLKISQLQAWYEESQVLFGVDLEVKEGEFVSLLGRNGAGKSTTLKSILGMLEKKTGDITWRGQNIAQLPAYAVARQGLAYCPEDRGIFASLSVEENLTLPPQINSATAFSLDEIYKLFPVLKERRKSSGTKLSGGEQQMLAFARMLRTGAKFLLVDEPTEGLAPVIVQQIEALLVLLKSRGYTLLLVEQSFQFCAKVVDRHYVIEHGKIVDHFDNQRLSEHRAKLEKYLCV